MLSLAASVVAEGVMDRLNVVKPAGKGLTLTKTADYAMRATAIRSATNFAFMGGSATEALRNAGVNFVYECAALYGANKIGKAYGGLTDDGQIDPNGPKIGFVEHKLLHGFLGGAIGAVRGDAAAGALGGMVAELVADLTVDEAKDIRARVDEKVDRQGISKSSQDYQNLVRAEVQTTMNWSKLGAAVAVALAGHDVDVGVDVATNALENNFVPLVAVGVAAVEALASASGATLAASAGVLTALGLNELANSFQENDDSSTVAMDAHPEGARWVDEGVTTEEARSRPLITPTPERMPTLGGYEAFPSSSSSHDGGFQIYDGPNASVLMSDESLPGKGKNWIKLKGTQGWKNLEDNTFWKKDMLHKDHWDISNEKGKKIREVDFSGKEIWPSGPKNKNKKPK